ncbi:cytochrome c oxidase-assembly factor mitochondrial [Fusarium avenaceum]|nr:cytochrome c oxidase-assembly factor mitochondrial [Fusarium avenaceum]
MSSTPKDAPETAEPPKTKEADSQPWNDVKRRKFETNGGDKNMCGDYFQAYRDCKQVWTEKRRKESGGWF